MSAWVQWVLLLLATIALVAVVLEALYIRTIARHNNELLDRIRRLETATSGRFASTAAAQSSLFWHERRGAPWPVAVDSYLLHTRVLELGELEAQTELRVPISVYVRGDALSGNRVFSAVEDVLDAHGFEIGQQRPPENG